ncbi:hypothetical protein BC834DRAFT_643100 [Gloeopeniophorella convolvens]|nr:hypothetical protein BC834DRAFT_643100 [Gloeopeniophorella convolvens]
MHPKLSSVPRFRYVAVGRCKQRFLRVIATCRTSMPTGNCWSLRGPSPAPATKPDRNKPYRWFPGLEIGAQGVRTRGSALQVRESEAAKHALTWGSACGEKEPRRINDGRMTAGSLRYPQTKGSSRLLLGPSVATRDDSGSALGPTDNGQRPDAKF